MCGFKTQNRVSCRNTWTCVKSVIEFLLQFIHMFTCFNSLHVFTFSIQTLWCVVSKYACDAIEQLHHVNTFQSPETLAHVCKRGGRFFTGNVSRLIFFYCVGLKHQMCVRVQVTDQQPRSGPRATNDKTRDPWTDLNAHHPCMNEFLWYGLWYSQKI